ncbi:MAG: LLM class flavin-dependent oxidoreductase [Alphaproteobacteria bacterium]|nr:LLM class flavin-dependent oxidoreductase [Alphaproteobacteria bacterium]
MSDIQFGLMIRGQFPQEEDMRVRFDEMVEQVRLIDRLGFASLTKGMHYSSHPLQSFNQLVFHSRMAAESSNLRLNFGIILLSLHKPLDIAEQLASLDVMSGGRVIFGAALGYREVELAAFGVQRKQIVRRFTENIEAIKRLWTEDTVSMKGSFFELLDANVSVKPIQTPHPPVWIGANADPAIERAARIGDCWYVNPHNRMDTIQHQVDVYKRALDAAGKPFPKEFPGRRECFVAGSRDEAIRLCRPYLAKKYEVYHSWGQDKVMPDGDNDLGLDFDELIKDRFFLGGPDEVAEQIIAYTKQTGINHHVLSCQWPGMPQNMVLDTLQLLAEEVFPRVRQGM